MKFFCLKCEALLPFSLLILIKTCLKTRNEAKPAPCTQYPSSIIPHGTANVTQLIHNPPKKVVFSVESGFLSAGGAVYISKENTTRMQIRSNVFICSSRFHKTSSLCIRPLSSRCHFSLSLSPPSQPALRPERCLLQLCRSQPPHS